LKGHSYTFGELDVGSLDLGPGTNIGTSMHTGAFRSEGVIGNGYFARALLPDLAEFPHYLPTKDFKRLRSDYNLIHAGNLVKFPLEIRLMIYEQYWLPSKSEKWQERSVVFENFSFANDSHSASLYASCTANNYETPLSYFSTT
jgi:hypothetical protein